jgi:hypothetical protein
MITVILTHYSTLQNVAKRQLTFRCVTHITARKVSGSSPGGWCGLLRCGLLDMPSRHAPLAWPLRPGERLKSPTSGEGAVS